MLLRPVAMLMAAALAAPAAAMPDDVARLAATLIDGDPLVADDSPVWFALASTPRADALHGRPGLEIAAAVAELSQQRPILVLGTPEFAFWRIFIPSQEPMASVDSWTRGMGSTPDWTLPRDGSSTTSMTRVALKTREGMILSDEYPTAYVYAREEVRSISMLLVPPGSWQQYAQARSMYTQMRPPAPLADDPAWALATEASSPDTVLIAGFRPARLMSGLHGRLPASSMLARLFTPDSWTDGWAVVDRHGNSASLAGSWSRQESGAPLLGEGGGHALLDLVSKDAQLAVGVHHAGAAAVWEWVRSALLEREYGGRRGNMLRDERELEAALGFSVAGSLLPAIGDGIVAGAARDLGNPASWCFVVEAADAPLLDDHVRQAVERLGGGVVEMRRNDLVVRVARFSSGPESQFVWAMGDSWMAFGFDQLAFQRFMRAPGEQSIGERLALLPGWTAAEDEAPVVVSLNGQAAGRLAERFVSVAAVAFLPQEGAVALRGAAELRPEQPVPAAEPSSRDPFAAAAGM